MKKENLKLKEMMEYVEHVPLNMIEASKVFEMEGDGRRNFDTPYVYFAMKTIRGLVKKGYDLHSFPKKFLNRFFDLHFNDAVNIMNIMYFKEDLEMNDIYKSVKAFTISLMMILIMIMIDLMLLKII